MDALLDVSGGGWRIAEALDLCVWCVQVIQLENYENAPTIPEEVIIRPWYRKGAEIMIYNDATHIHSAPDSFHREAVWRFM